MDRVYGSDKFRYYVPDSWAYDGYILKLIVGVTVQSFQWISLTCWVLVLSVGNGNGGR